MPLKTSIYCGKYFAKIKCLDVSSLRIFSMSSFVSWNFFLYATHQFKACRTSPVCVDQPWILSESTPNFLGSSDPISAVGLDDRPFQ